MVHIAPDIPFMADKAFYPIEKDLNGVYYSWRECTRRIIVCTKWETKKVHFGFDNKEMMNYFKANDFGFYKRPQP